MSPYSSGTPEGDEWEEIAAAPSWHSRPAPVRRTRLAELDSPVRLRSLAASDHPDAVAAHAEQVRSLAAAGVIFGPDVSQYQGKPAWATVKASGCVIKFWKATEGRTFLDPSAAHNATRLAGTVEAAYHFLYFSQEYVDRPALWGAQAEWFARNAREDVGHVLDVEAAATAGNHLGVREWAAEYRRLFPGHPLGGYLNRSLWRNRSRMPYDPDGIFDYVWHAGIGDGFYTPAKGSIASEWAAVGSLSNSVSAMGYPTVELWQITDHAAVPGVVGLCDGNAYQGSAAELSALLTGKAVDTSMSAADVQNLQTYLGSDDFKNVVRAAVHGTAIGRLKNPDGTPVTLGQIAAAMWAALPNVDELSPAAVASVADAIGPVVSGGSGFTRDELVDALTEALSRIHVVADPPASA
jgi:GH25 family lysozyme M1 (1,4-beta-N-acetylmuramidase)